MSHRPLAAWLLLQRTAAAPGCTDDPRQAAAAEAAAPAPAPAPARVAVAGVGSGGGGGGRRGAGAAAPEAWGDMRTDGPWIGGE